MGMNKPIRLDAIKREAQARAATSPEAIAEYADDMREGQRFPPIIVFLDGNTYWLADGFHRVAAAELAGSKRSMLRSSAADYAMRSSRHHLWADRSDRSLADIFAVQDELVRAIVATQGQSSSKAAL